ncbi:MAG: hypothetical protein KJ041_04545 [Gammaproteobacteria bacterium]|nr:hypothetical protein [Gammaproteobacteria bacterium]
MPRTSYRPSAIRAIGLRSAVLALCIGVGAVAADPEPCIRLFRKGVLNTPFNPAFLHVSTFRDAKGRKRDALLMSSFFNVEKDAAGMKVERFTERDLAAWIPDLDGVDPAAFEARRELEVLTDRNRDRPLTVWPNETEKVPDGVLPFQAIVVPGGFLSDRRPGRLVLVKVDDPARTEYVVAEAGTAEPVCANGQVQNERWYYHGAVFIDMDGDGLRDLVTARASLMPFMYGCPPSGELLWFRNPGPALDPGVQWQPTVLVGLPRELDGPEVNLTAADLDDDGVEEIIATHFFTSDQIEVFGAPAGQEWRTVNPAEGRPVRRQAIMSGQGRPFAVQAVDLNRDGRPEILTSNHQGDGCFEVTRDAIPGRVLALQQPASGRLFDEPWTTHILKDDIRPQPTFPAPVRGPGRLAPNRAIALWPARWMEGLIRPWILVGGDEAAKIWVLKPMSRRKNDWRYESVVIFDINKHYGPGTTQTLMNFPQGVSISTIGGLTWRYDRPGAFGRAEIYAPVFEARQIHIFSFRPGTGEPVACGSDARLACPN